MKMKRTAFIMLAVAAVLSCSKVDNEPTPYQKITLGTKAAEVNASFIDFSLGLNEAIATKSDEKQNYCLSPLSAALNMALLLNGADGTTFAEIKKVLGLDSLTESDVNAYVRTMMDLIRTADNQTTISFSSSLWSRKTFVPSFTETCRTFYDSEIFENESFGSSTQAELNKWAKRVTNGMISEFTIPDLEFLFFLVTNNLYFKGIWSECFEESKTKNGQFKLTDGTVVTVPMMSAKFKKPKGYLRLETCKCVELPYGNGHYSMLLIVPDEEHTLADAHRAVRDTEALSRIETYMGRTNLTLTMPRFSIASSLELQDALAGMGLKSLFNSRDCDLTKMTPEGGAIGRVMQKAVINVDESGTEAATSTVSTSEIGASGYEVTIDRPFAFAIIEKDTNAILFSGQVANPSK